MFDVVGIGDPCVDINVNVAQFPKPNQGARIQLMTRQGGGKVATGIAAAARLGASCAVLCAVGDDENGRFCKADFERHGVNTDRMLLRSGETTSLAIVLSDYASGGRSIMYRPGSTAFLQPEELDQAWIRQAKFLFVAQPNDTVLAAVRCAKQHNVSVLIDADSYQESLIELLPQIDYFIASEFVYRAFYGESNAYEQNCRDMLCRGPKAVVFTFGEKGCFGCGEEGYFSLPAFAVAVQDTVGAGDVFHGAFLAGLLSERSLKETARFASAASAIKCTRIGGRAGIPNRETLEHFLQNGEIDYHEIDQRVKFYQQGV